MRQDHLEYRNIRPLISLKVLNNPLISLSLKNLSMIGDAEVETLIVAEEVAVIRGISHFGGPGTKACVQFDNCAECVANGR